jgi:hypothetical protein
VKLRPEVVKSDERAFRDRSGCRMLVAAMADLVFILVILVFFALCVAYTRGLDRLVRASEEGEEAQEGMS